MAGKDKERTRAVPGTDAPKRRRRVSAGTSPVDERTSLALAVRTARKARGLLLTAPNDKALLLMPCNDVHTVGMRHPLDVAFVDGEGRVVETHRSVGPLRRLRNTKAVAVVERFACCDTPWFAIGDQVMISGKKEVAR